MQETSKTVSNIPAKILTKILIKPSCQDPCKIPTKILIRILIKPSCQDPYKIPATILVKIQKRSLQD